VDGYDPRVLSERKGRAVGGNASDALRTIADLLDRMPGLPEHVVTVYSDSLHIGLLFGAGPDEEVRREAVRRVLAELGTAPGPHGLEYGGTGTLAGYTVEVSTGFD
jgi:hypothetical protein